MYSGFGAFRFETLKGSDYTPFISLPLSSTKIHGKKHMAVKFWESSVNSAEFICEYRYLMMSIILFRELVKIYHVSIYYRHTFCIWDSLVTDLWPLQLSFSFSFSPAPSSWQGWRNVHGCASDWPVGVRQLSKLSEQQ